MLAMLAFASPAWAEIFEVDRNDDPDLTGSTIADDCTAAPNNCSLRGAIEGRSATNGAADTIVFDFVTLGTITLGDALTVENDTPANDLTINGPGQSSINVKQSAAVRVFQIVGKTTINDITISGGRSINNAGGILNGGILTLNDTTVTDNQALGTQADTGDGGGIFNAIGANLTLNRSTVTDNLADNRNGGGIYNDNGSTLTLNNSTVSGNDTGGGGGGGIYNNSATLTLTNSSVNGTNNAFIGGGIYNDSGTLKLTNSTISGNQASNGGGIYSDTNLPPGTQKTTVTNSTISGNTAGAQGGGIYNSDGLTTIEYSTITNNTATLSGDGSGVASFGTATTTRTEVLSSIVSANNNTDVDFTGADNIFKSKGYNRIGDGNATAAFNKPGDKTLVMVPGLGPLANNGGPTLTHALLKGSPALDAVPEGRVGCGTKVTKDQRGIKRPQGTKCDVGAYEKKVKKRR
jgi:hypothetical protein